MGKGERGEILFQWGLESSQSISAHEKHTVSLMSGHGIARTQAAEAPRGISEALMLVEAPRRPWEESEQAQLPQHGGTTQWLAAGFSTGSLHPCSLRLGQESATARTHIPHTGI